MPLNWVDVSHLSFNSLLLLEKVQLSWLPAAVEAGTLAIALQAHPHVEWYLRHKCPPLNPWLDQILPNGKAAEKLDPQTVRAAEVRILQSIEDWLVYVTDPQIYDRQTFLNWDSNELTALTQFEGKVILDIGAGTGRLAFVAAAMAQVVYCVEPVSNLREFIRHKARQAGLSNVFAVDGLITQIPFPDQFADITMGGHVFGDDPAQEYAELARVTRPGGMIILCPGNNDQDNVVHAFLIEQGFACSRFEEPGDGMKRKYWKTLAQP